MEFVQYLKFARMDVSFHTDFENLALLDALWIAYTKFYPIESLQQQNSIQSIHTELCRLSSKKKRSIFRLVADLCIAHERSAFLEGIRMGVHLADELNSELVHQQGQKSEPLHSGRGGKGNDSE